MASSDQRAGPDNELRAAFNACRQAMIALLFFSLCINLLMLTAPLYMLQVFDRVLNSRSSESLVYLTIIAVVLFTALGAVEAVRHQILSRLGAWIDRRISGELLRSAATSGLDNGATASVQGLRDLKVLRGFVSGHAILPALDAPWFPIFIAVIFLLHPWLGWLAVGSALALLSLAVLNEFLTRRPLNLANASAFQALEHAEAVVRNADAVHAMGMMPDLLRRWARDNERTLELQRTADGRNGAIKSLSRSLRMSLQILILGLGAWLVLDGAITPGGMIAGSILFARALAPVDQTIGSWHSAMAARQAYRRIVAQLADYPAPAPAISLPTPKGRLRVDGVTYLHPGASEPILNGIAFDLEPGETLGLIGPTAAGKTTLARLLVGNLRPRIGHVRLDGADVAAWNSEDRGRHVGYLPQDIELFGGTVRDNIARMGEGDPEAIIAAAQAADVHDLILHLPKGYETEIGGGLVLSGGQRQRIALARALYGDPRLVVLDEPNANLDQTGEQALARVIERLRERRVSTVIITHRMWILRRVDKILVLSNGGPAMYGPRDEIFAKVMGPQIGRARATAESAGGV